MKYPILDSLKAPSDIKKLSFKDLKLLSEDVRHRITEVVRETGGHLGPNLGAVEIIIACHRVFDLKQDRIIYDVGHQAYAHKILTGRHHDFDTLRQKGGISGYPHQDESPYDVSRTGHASTAISTALGILEGYDHLPEKKDRKVLAFVGDGSLTGGMAFEGLNHAGHLNKNLIVILNDNRMSISPTVGALSATFNKLRHQKVIQNFREDFTAIIKKIPKFGGRLEEMANYVYNETKHLINPGQIFTDLGFDYRGPIQGHNIKALIKTLEAAAEQKGPVLIHVLTDKGKGYRPEGRQGKEKIGPHALSPGTREKEEAQKLSGSTPEKKPSYSLAFASHLADLADIDQSITAITAAMPDGTALQHFADRHPNQYYDVGICEQHAAGFAGGLSLAGKRPVFAVYSTFLQRAIDQVFHDLILQGNLPTLFCIDRAGLVGDDGPSHHGLYDIGLLRVFPNITLMAPKDGQELRKMMEAALSIWQPSAIRYPRAEIPEDDFFGQCAEIVSGMPEILEEGDDVCLLAYGSMVHSAALASRTLAAEDIKVGLVNARFVKPLSRDFILDLASRYKRLITIEEAALPGGFGSAVLELLENSGNSMNSVHRMGVPDRLIEHATRGEQLLECGLDVESIIKKVKEVLK